MSEDPVDKDAQLLPIANVSRIMKRGLPHDSKVAKDSKETIQECVSEFISFITSEASDKCAHEKRKTITADDILWAMNSLGFDSYNDVLKQYLLKYKEVLDINIGNKETIESQKEGRFDAAIFDTA
jgi:histone H3/H4